jgi:hypothetical protein
MGEGAFRRLAEVIERDMGAPPRYTIRHVGHPGPRRGTEAAATGGDVGEAHSSSQVA